MSVVIALATSNKAIIKSDGREVEKITHKIVSENAQKIFRLSENCIIGITGNYQYCREALEARNFIHEEEWQIGENGTSK